jgi:hypothetical protein
MPHKCEAFFFWLIFSVFKFCFLWIIDLNICNIMNIVSYRATL